MRLAFGLALVVLAAAATPAAARPGDVDRGFGRGGGITVPLGYSPAINAELFERANRRILVAGLDSVLQLTGGGSRDRRFGDRGTVAFEGARSTVAGAAVDRRGRTYLVLAPEYWDGRFDLVRLRRDGALDTGFGPAGRRALPTIARDFSVADIVADRRGRLVLTGATRTDGRGRIVVARLRADGTPDPSFGGDGFVVGPRGVVSGSALLQRGRILVPARPFARRPRDRRVVLLALRENGRPLNGYGRRGRTALAFGTRRFTAVTRFTAGPGRSVIATGEVFGGPTREQTDVFAARITGGGRIDRRFGRRGLVRLHQRNLNLFPNAITTDARGRILIAANEEYQDRVAVFRLRRGGSRDRRFGRRGAVTLRLGGRPGFAIVAAEAADIEVTRSGRILVAGTAYDDQVESRDDFGTPYLAVTALRGR